MRTLVVVTALLLPAPAHTQAPVQDASAQKAPAEEKKICKKIETTGTRLGAKKVCATKAEWDEVARKGRDFTTRIQQGAGRTGLPEDTAGGGPAR